MPTDLGAHNALLLRRLKLAGIVAGCLALLVVVFGLTSRFFVSRAVAHWTAEQLVPTVSVIAPVPATGSNTLILPGTLQAFYSAPIYARVPGYLQIWYKDIGAQVHKGDVLGVIETPELDQQIEQAKADLANAAAAQQLSQTTAQRWSGLLKLDAVSRQESEEKSSDLVVKNAQVKSAQANLHRLTDLKTFARIVAPFDGVVTNRSVDIGALINAGAQTSEAPLFTVADVHSIRVYVSVPQIYSAEVRPGVTATLSLPEYPTKTFSAALDTTSDAISERSNALLVEFLANNPDSQLKPGGYAQVTIHFTTPKDIVTIPASALIFNAQGLHVATVLPNDRIAMKPIKIARDLGTAVEVDAGLTRASRVVDNPPDSIAQGDRVQTVQSGNNGVAAK